MHHIDSDSDSNWQDRPTQTDIDLLEMQISQIKQEKKLLNLDLSKNELLNRKRYLALIEMNKNLEKSNKDNMKLKEQNELLLGKKHEERRKKKQKYQIELTDALNNRIYSDTDWKNYLNTTEPILFKKLLQEKHFIDDISGAKNPQNVEVHQETNKKIRDLYTKSYINLKKSGLINGWDYKRTEISRGWKNELKYMYTVNNYFMHELKKKEGMWSWILIVISSVVSVVSILDLTDITTVIILQYSVTLFSVITSLVAAYIKKENYVERIKELDRYIQKVGKIVTSIEYVINQKPWNRQDYKNFQERFQNEVNALLSTPPPMSPAELKNTVYDLTKTHPENLKETYPWYKLKMYNTMPYYSMTEYGRDILDSYWNDNLCRKLGVYMCCTSKLELRARAAKKDAIEWFHDKHRDRDIEKGYYGKRFPPPIGLTNRYEIKWRSFDCLKKPAKCIGPRRRDNKCIFCCSCSVTVVLYLIWTPFIFIYFLCETIRMFFMPCFVPEYNQFLYPENYNLLKEREMKYRVMKEEDEILGNTITDEERQRINNQNLITNRDFNMWGGNNGYQYSNLKQKLEKEKKEKEMFEQRYLTLIDKYYKNKSNEEKESIQVEIKDELDKNNIERVYSNKKKEIEQEKRKINRKMKKLNKIKKQQPIKKHFTENDIDDLEQEQDEEEEQDVSRNIVFETKDISNN